MERNDFSIVCRESPKEHFCEIILKSGHCSRRRCRLKKLLTDGRTDGRTDDGQIPIIIAHLELFVLSELKVEGNYIPQATIWLNDSKRRYYDNIEISNIKCMVQWLDVSI